MHTFWFLILGMTGISLLWVSAPFVVYRAHYRTLFFILLPGLFLVSIGTYWILGSHHELAASIQSQKINAEAAAVMKNIHSPEQVVAMLQAHLAKDPSSAKGWYLLGQIYFSLQKMDLAINAYGKAHQLDLENNDYTVSYVEAMFIKNHQHLDAHSMNLIQTVLKKNPKNISAMSLIAMNAYANKNYSVAIAEWEKMLPLFPEGSSDSKIILNAIAKAQKISARPKD